MVAGKTSELNKKSHRETLGGTRGPQGLSSGRAVAGLWGPHSRAPQSQAAIPVQFLPKSRWETEAVGAGSSVPSGLQPMAGAVSQSGSLGVGCAGLWEHPPRGPCPPSAGAPWGPALLAGFRQWEALTGGKRDGLGYLSVISLPREALECLLLLEKSKWLPQYWGSTGA